MAHSSHRWNLLRITPPECRPHREISVEPVKVRRLDLLSMVLQGLQAGLKAHLIARMGIFILSHPTRAQMAGILSPALSQRARPLMMMATDIRLRPETRCPTTAIIMRNPVPPNTSPPMAITVSPVLVQEMSTNAPSMATSMLHTDTVTRMSPPLVLILDPIQDEAIDRPLISSLLRHIPRIAAHERSLKRATPDDSLMMVADFSPLPIML